MNANVRYRYLTQRRVNNIGAQHALYIARNSAAFDALDTEPERQAFRVLERDGLEFHIFIEFDADAYYECVNEVDADGVRIPQWWVKVEYNGEHIDSCGGIGGGYWVGNDYPDMDNATKAYVWADFIDPWCDAAAVRAAWVAELV